MQWRLRAFWWAALPMPGTAVDFSCGLGTLPRLVLGVLTPSGGVTYLVPAKLHYL